MTSINAKHEALLDELLNDYTDPQDSLGEHGLLKQLTKRVVERVLEAELTAYLGYAPYARHGTAEQNTRNGKGQKTVQTDTGPVDLAVPRARNGRFAPQRVPTRQRRLEGFEAKVLSLYARGLSTREIQGHLAERYGTEVSPTLISTITDAVLDEVRTWQARPLASGYPLLYFDALLVKARQEGRCRRRRGTSRWASLWTARRHAWGCGSGRARGPNAGSPSAPSCTIVG